MDLNRETAMRLWVKSFGNVIKAIDFAGREIVKGAYNDRNSKYGWNVDHILPQSKGGKTADHNLICCSIQTNDEKADTFPCFSANGNKFEIIKVQNHYEIRPINKVKQEQQDKYENINLYDSAAGIRLFKKLKGIQNKSRFVGSVLIRIKGLNNTAVVDFIEELFKNENISYPDFRDYGYLLWSNQQNEFRIMITNYNMPLKEDIEELLDKCVLLNTYLGYYFKELGYIDTYEIDYTVNHFDNKNDMYSYMKNGGELAQIRNELENSIYINELVIENTDAKNKVKSTNELTEYNYVYTELSKNLKKEVEGR